MKELHDTIKSIGAAFQDFRAKNDERVGRLERTVDAIDTKLARSEFPGGTPRTTVPAAAAEHGKKFLAWVRTGADPEGLRSLEVNASASTLSDPDGGYLVPLEVDKKIETLSRATVAMRRLARVVVLNQGHYARPISKTGATSGWVGEKDARPETDTPELSLFQPPWCEIYAMPTATQKLLDLAGFDIEAWLTEEISQSFNALEGAAFISGNGTGRPKGLIAYDTVANASWAYGKIGYIASGNATAFNDADKLFDLQHALKPVYRQNATWLMNDATLNTIRNFKDGEGNYLWRPSLEAGTPDMLLGRPVAIDENMPDIGENAYPVAFGDFSRAYTVVDHARGIRLLRDPYSVKGSVCFYTTKRVAGGISNYEAVKLLKIAA